MQIGVINESWSPVKYGRPRLMKMADSMKAMRIKGSEKLLVTMAIMMKMATIEIELTI